jgi:hypothetical protein
MRGETISTDHPGSEAKVSTRKLPNDARPPPTDRSVKYSGTTTATLMTIPQSKTNFRLLFYETLRAFRLTPRSIDAPHARSVRHDSAQNSRR